MLRKLALLLLIFSLGFLSYAYADKDDAWAVGKDSSGEYFWRINDTGALLPGTTEQNSIGGSSNTVDDIYYSGALVPSATASNKVAYEVFTTGDTLTAADSGRQLITYLDDADGYINFTLPAVSAGLEYKIAVGHTSYVYINPYGTNQIMYSTCDAGDQLKSAGASADSVTIVSDGTRWYVTEMKGTWTDGGA